MIEVDLKIEKWISTYTTHSHRKRTLCLLGLPVNNKLGGVKETSECLLCYRHYVVIHWVSWRYYQLVVDFAVSVGEELKHGIEGASCFLSPHSLCLCYVLLPLSRKPWYTPPSVCLLHRHTNPYTPHPIHPSTQCSHAFYHVFISPPLHEHLQLQRVQFLQLEMCYELCLDAV
jgi:hypothetical protein